MDEKQLKGLAKAVISQIGLIPNNNRPIGILKKAILEAIKNYSGIYNLDSEEAPSLKRYVSNIISNDPYSITWLGAKINS